MSRVLTFVAYLLLLAVSLGAAAFAVMGYLTTTRGVEPGLPAVQTVIGANVALEQYTDDAALQRALDALKRQGVTTARQYFPWREIEPQRGQYDWAKWDRIVNAAQANGISLVAVLHTAPQWSQREYERDLPGAPANDPADYARFAGDFAKRYGDSIQYYQIWDEPNVAPNWGHRNADPVEYAQMLIPAAQAIRANDADAKIVLAGLAMNLEVHRPHPYYSEILFLRGLYEIGAASSFDIVAAKPYGMWTGPEDRTVNSGVLNFSRLILLRDEMLQYGDKNKPVWAVEMGWNALPPDWQGDPSPWGTDTETVQADRLKRGLARLEQEWNWVTAAFPLYLQPNVAPTDPRRGFAELNPDGSARALYDAVAGAIAAPAAPLPPPSAPWLPVALLAGVAVIAAWRGWHWLVVLELGARWQAFKTRVNSLSTLGELAVLAALAVAFYFSPSVPLNFLLLALLVLGFALRLDLGIVLTIFVIPYWNFPKTLFGGFELSPVEVLTWAATAAFVLNWLLTPHRTSRLEGRAAWRALRAQMSRLDWTVLALLALALVSTRWAGNFGVASREFRVVVLDSVLLYLLIRTGHFALRQYRWFVWSLLASGVAICVIGLYQFVTGDVILAEGVARLTAVWGSPNNVSLYLGRLLPIALAFALILRRDPGSSGKPGALPFLPHWSIRAVYIALVILYGLTIFLTFSRGALFLGVPVSILFLVVVIYTQAHHVSRRLWLVLGAVLLLGVLALVPFLNTDRFSSLFQTGTGTGFFRVAVWTSAVNMIRDHPLLGVGLDNFLYEYPKYILPAAWREPNLSHPHNILLDFWVRLGILGVLLMGALLVLFYKRAWRTYRLTSDLYPRALMLGLMASVVNMLAHGSIDAAFFVIDLAYLFMLTLALAQIEPKEK